MRTIILASIVAAVLAVGAPDNGLGEDYSWVAWDDATAMAAAVQKPIMVGDSTLLLAQCSAALRLLSSPQQTMSRF